MAKKTTQNVKRSPVGRGGKPALAVPPASLSDGALAAALTHAVESGRTARETARDEMKSYTSFHSEWSGFLRRRQYIGDSADQNGLTLASVAKANPEWFLEFLVDREPLLSSVLEKFVDITSGEFTISVTKNGKPHAGGQRYVSEFITRMTQPVPNGYQQPMSIRRLLRKQLHYLFVRKADALEVVFDDQFQPVEIVVIDPLSIEFSSPTEGSFDYHPYQRRRGSKSVNMDVPNFIWVPHSSWGDPHARNPLLGGIKKVLGMMQLHQDLELVVHHAAWPRLQIGYDLAALRDLMPPGLQDEQEQIKWVESQIDQIVARYADLQADDNVAFARDLSEVKYLELQHTSGEIFSPEQLMRALEARILDACDTLTTTIGRSAFSGEGASALDGLVQAAVWGAMRQTVEVAMSRALTLALLVGKGLAARVELRFEDIVLEPHGKLSVWVKQDLENLRSAYLMGGILDTEMAAEARRVTRLSGAVPQGAVMDDDWVRGNKVAGDPVRDPSAESTKETKRKDSNKSRRSTGGEN